MEVGKRQHSRVCRLGTLLPFLQRRGVPSKTMTYVYFLNAPERSCIWLKGTIFQFLLVGISSRTLLCLVFHCRLHKTQKSTKERNSSNHSASSALTNFLENGHPQGRTTHSCSCLFEPRPWFIQHKV